MKASVGMKRIEQFLVRQEKEEYVRVMREGGSSRGKDTHVMGCQRVGRAKRGQPPTRDPPGTGTDPGPACHLAQLPHCPETLAEPSICLSLLEWREGLGEAACAAKQLLLPRCGN